MSDLTLYDVSGKPLHDQACESWEGVLSTVKDLNGEMDRALDDRLTGLTASDVQDRVGAIAGYARELHDVLTEMIREGNG